jgi:hypothetical protein
MNEAYYPADSLLHYANEAYYSADSLLHYANEAHYSADSLHYSVTSLFCLLHCYSHPQYYQAEFPAEVFLFINYVTCHNWTPLKMRPYNAWLCVIKPNTPSHRTASWIQFMKPSKNSSKRDVSQFPAWIAKIHCLNLHQVTPWPE